MCGNSDKDSRLIHVERMQRWDSEDRSDGRDDKDGAG